MHKSTPTLGAARYPYHFDRWVCPHLFWPYLVPRQVTVQDDSSGPLFWGDIHESFYGISEGGIRFNSRRGMKYYLTPISPLIPRECWVSINTIQNVPGVWIIRYTIELQRGDILNPYHYRATGERTEEVPVQPECLIAYWQDAIDVITGNPIATPRTQFRFTTWGDLA